MERLVKLYESLYGTAPTNTEQIKGSGSARQYYRLSSKGNSAIGVIGSSLEENRAFIEITRHFNKQNLPVPTVYNVSPDGMAYLQSDLGSISLYQLLTNSRNNCKYTDADFLSLEKAVRGLPRMQIIGAQGLDLSLCYPTAKMDETAIHFDFNYFKYCFLKLQPKIDFNELDLEKDFCAFCEDIINMSSSEDSLILRDCQARNVMMKSDGESLTPYFIDYQGCRIGPKEYDLASFLWQSSAHYPQELRDRLVECYIEALRELRPDTNPDTVRKNLELMVLFRLVQVLGAYGFRGLIERKAYFLNSIPGSIANLKDVLNKGTAKPHPYLENVLKSIVQNNEANSALPSASQQDNKLTVTIYSFSFKKGIPVDPSGNGGGYVFDCRSTHNPGKYDQYKELTGLDAPVIKFLEEDGEITTFLNSVYPIVTHHVQRFSERGFTHLMICFGCTGGRHRSVYSAQHTAEHLRRLFPDINIHLIHRERNIDVRL
jgi:N-acetylmuramate 1-kinase